MSLRPTFVAFTPWTTLDDYLELCASSAPTGWKSEVDPVQLLAAAAGAARIGAAGAPDIAPFLGPLDAGGAQLPVDAPRSAHGPPRGRRLGARGGGDAGGEPPAATFRASTAWPRPPRGSRRGACAERYRPQPRRRAAAPDRVVVLLRAADAPPARRVLGRDRARTLPARRARQVAVEDDRDARDCTGRHLVARRSVQQDRRHVGVGVRPAVVGVLRNVRRDAVPVPPVTAMSRGWSCRRRWAAAGPRTCTSSPSRPACAERLAKLGRARHGVVLRRLADCG